MSAHGSQGSKGHGHETSDASTRPFFRSVAALAVFVGAAMVVMAMLFSFFSQEATESDTSLTPLAKEAPPPVSAGPQLQPNPPVDLAKMHHDEDAQLETYGWVDQREGLVHIPIERAIELMGERGLPARSSPPPAGP
jgi:hypothetical protein